MQKMKNRTNKKRMKRKTKNERMKKGKTNKMIIVVNQEQALKRRILPMY